MLCMSANTLDDENLSRLKDLQKFKVKVPVLGVTGADLALSTAKGNTANGSLVFFGAPWCKHSRMFNSTYQSLAQKSYLGLLPASPSFWYYEVQDPAKDLHHRYFRVKGFPTVLYVWKNQYWSFDGQRNLHDLENWLGDIWGGVWREGEPYPNGAPTLRDDISSVIRDIKFFFSFHVRNHPIELMVGALCVTASFVAVLGILGMIIYDAVFIGWANENESAANPIEELDHDEEGKLIKANIDKKTIKKLIKQREKQVAAEELRKTNPRQYREYTEMEDIAQVVGVSDSSEEDEDGLASTIEAANKAALDSLAQDECQDMQAGVRDRKKGEQLWNHRTESN